MILPPPVPAISASPAPSASPRELKTIVTVISSPYCNSLAEHFNSALVPMLANDRTLDATGVQLDNLNDLWSQPNYEQRFLIVRDKLGRQVTEVGESLSTIQQQINLLREGERLTTDTQAAAQIHTAAEQLQAAYNKQRQLQIDLLGVHQAMIDYHIERANPAMGGFDPQEMSMPADMKDVKSYLRFDGQRDVIARAEDKAVDVAYAAATSYCTKPH